MTPEEYRVTAYYHRIAIAKSQLKGIDLKRAPGVKFKQWRLEKMIKNLEELETELLFLVAPKIEGD